jgi:predicted porin
MKYTRTLWRAFIGAAMAFLATTASAQLDYSGYGVLDFSYGRFEPAGTFRVDRFNSNSMSPSFVGVNAKYAFESGWTPGVTLESFVRFQDFKGGRNDNDPFFSRKAFVSLANNDYGTVSVGRLQTLLFDSSTRFNAMGNSTTFSPAMHQLFASGNIEGVQGDFYWDRALGYSSPSIGGVTANLMYAMGPLDQRSDLGSLGLVYSRGLFAAALTAQRVHTNNGIVDPTVEATWQLGATYNFGFLRAFGLYTQTNDSGLDVHSHLTSGGVAVPIGPGTFLAQAGYTTADGPAVDRKHTSLSAAYLYAYDSVTDLYVVGMEDRIRGLTRGTSIATGVRFRF